MATPTSTTIASTAAAGADLAAAPPQISSHPAPRAYYPASARSPPLFAGQPLPGRPLTSPTQSHHPQPVLHSAAHRSFPSRASTPHRPDHHIPVSNTLGFIRPPAAPNAVMTFSAHMRPIVYPSAAVSEKQIPVLRGRLPSPVQTQPMPSPYLVPRPASVVTSCITSPTSTAAFPAGAGSAEFLNTGPSKNAQAAVQPKVNSVPPVPLAPSDKNSKEREKSRDDDVVMIQGRKVRLLDSGSSSLYSLCRSWVQNGMPHEIQPNFGDSERLLPKPLCVSMVDSQMSQNNEGDAETEGPLKEKSGGSVEELSARDLLDEHIKRAKRVRSRLRKERLLRIERYKQRLSLLLPPPSELGRNDVSS